MTLAASGEMSIGGSTATRSINLELGRTASATSNLNETDLRTLAGVTTGTISISNFYGKTKFTPADGLADISDETLFATANAVMNINTDGTQSGDATGSWGTPTTTGIGNSYEVYFSRTTYTKSPTGVTWDTWLPLSSTRTVTLTATRVASSIVTETATVEVRIRPNSGATSFTASVFMEAISNDIG